MTRSPISVQIHLWIQGKKKGTLQISHKAWIQWNVFDKPFVFIWLDCFQMEKHQHWPTGKQCLGNKKQVMENSQPSLLFVNTYSTSPNFPLTLPCLTVKKKQRGEKGGRSEGGREEVESPFMNPGHLLPHVHLSDCLTHAVIIQPRHKSGDAHGRSKICK